MTGTATDRMGQILTIEGHRAIRFQRSLDHPVDRVWQAVTTPEGLAAWFPCRVEGDLTTQGSELRFRFGDDQPGLADEEHTGNVLEVEPPQRLRFTWMDDIVEIEIAPHGDGSQLTFTNVIVEEPDTATRTAAGWHACLDAFERQLAGASGEDDSPAAWRALYQRYVALNDVPDPRLAAQRTETGDGRVAIRFVRELPHPIEKVWQGIITPEGQAQWYPTRIEGDVLTEGAQLRYTWDGQSPEEVIDGTVLVCEPPRRWSIDGRGGEQLVDIELEALADDLTRLTFTHTFSPDADMEPMLAAGWHLYMDTLTAWLEGITMVANDGNHGDVTTAYAERWAAAG